MDAAGGGSGGVENGGPLLEPLLQRKEAACRESPGLEERVIAGGFGSALILSHYASNPPNSCVWGPREAGLGKKVLA